MNPYESNHGDDSLRSGEYKEPAITTTNNPTPVLVPFVQVVPRGVPKQEVSYTP